ncbi:WcaI family glycosyltransferase [Caulobacter segnis]|uniref:WcaI family glycosyltransferase n=1 Tax=Caulobacter segnis TaxID=88688 RepID=UPI00285611BC|nr:WcaI family glycosyltransferase [Caulobacter segnis]MDR6624946.1 colanic acid biosynthesis glycosyl transferase WcaI [Caulobacter segnis]
MSRRIFIYGMNYAPEFTGVGRYTGEIGEHLVSIGHEVSVVTTAPHYPGWKARDGYSAKAWFKEMVAGATVFRCPLYLDADMKGFKRLLAPLTFALTSAPVAFYQILKQRPDVVLAVEPTLFVAPMALLAGKLVGAKVVLHVQDLEIDAAFAVGHLRKGGLLAKLGAAFERVVMKGFDRVITISHRMAEKIVEKGVKADRVEMIRNWVDVDRIKPLAGASPYRDELGLTDKDFVVLYAGAIGAKQGVGLLIEAARLLADRPEVVFVVAGDGPMRPALEEAAKSLPNLRVKPFQPEERFNDFLGLADLHVLPQERGAADLLLPSKLGGMLASGRRILVTADAGTELALFLGDSCAFVPPGDSRAMAEAIARESGAGADPDASAARLQRAASLAKATVIERFVAAVTEWRGAPASLVPNEKY